MTELKRILCAVDFSDCSRRALDHALAVARCYGSSVTALHVMEPAPVVAPGPPPHYVGAATLGSTALSPIDRNIIAAQVQRLADAEQVPGVPVATLVAEAPVISSEILAQAERLGTDLLVMGTHGRSGLERLFLGSTAEQVLRKARCPVMTVPSKAADAVPRGPVPFTRILCAVDFSESSKRALDYATRLAEEGQAVLTLAHIIETRPLYYDFAPPMAIDLTAWIEEARTRLRTMVPDAVRSSCSIREVVREGKPSREILRLADEGANDLLVLGVQGRGAANLFVFGSTTYHVMREAHCAVLTLRG